MRENEIERLITSLKDADDKVRAKAAEALDEFRDKSTLEPLLQVLNDESEAVRRYAAYALAGLKDQMWSNP